MYRINFKFAFVLSVLVFGLVLFLLPGNSHAGTFVGCCITNGGQCSPSCGPAGSSCQRDFPHINPCNGTIIDISVAEQCGDDEAPGAVTDNCFVSGAVCFQYDNSVAGCLPAPPTPTPTPTPTVTPSVTPTPPPPCFPNENCETEDICFVGECNVSGNFCVFSPNPEEADNPVCNPAPTAVVPTLSQWGMIIAVLVIGFFAVIRLWIKRDSDI